MIRKLRSLVKINYSYMRRYIAQTIVVIVVEPRTMILINRSFFVKIAMFHVKHYRKSSDFIEIEAKN